MPEIKFIDPEKSQLETVLRWLKKEHLGELEGCSGFYCNRDTIRQAFRASEMKCLMLGKKVIGFAIFNLRINPRPIDIFEIRPGYRQKGYGKIFANHIINLLLSSGAKYIVVECSPRSSEPFWRSLGFVYKGEKSHVMGNPKLHLIPRLLTQQN